MIFHFSLDFTEVYKYLWSQNQPAARLPQIARVVPHKPYIAKKTTPWATFSLPTV